MSFRLGSFFAFLTRPARAALPFAAAPAARLATPGHVVEVVSPERYLRLHARAPHTIVAARPVPTPLGAAGAAGDAVFGRIAVTRRVGSDAA